MTQRETLKENSKYIELNENANTTYQNCVTVKSSTEREIYSTKYKKRGKTCNQ